MKIKNLTREERKAITIIKGYMGAVFYNKKTDIIDFKVISLSTLEDVEFKKLYKNNKNGNLYLSV